MRLAHNVWRVEIGSQSLIFARAEYDGRRTPPPLPLPLQFQLGVHESSLHPETHPVVFANSFAVEQLGKRRLDVVIDVEKLCLVGGHGQFDVAW